MTRRTLVHRISASAPDNVSGIEAAIASRRIDPKGVLAVLAKTEGNGLVNDFSRGHATMALSLLFQRHLPKEDASRICLVMSGGTEGAMAPHWVVFERAPGDGRSGPSLAIGRALTAALPFEQLGRLVQVDTLKSMGLSRAASALGAAVALGEIKCDALRDTDIGANWSLWSSRASASAGIELLNHEIVVMGMSSAWSGPLAIDHAVMADAIDIEPVRAALKRLRVDAPGQLRPEQQARIVALLGKAEASHDGQLRGYRHTMLDDSDIAATRHARAFVCGALAVSSGTLKSMSPVALSTRVQMVAARYASHPFYGEDCSRRIVNCNLKWRRFC